jgi:hypothetical protein
VTMEQEQSGDVMKLAACNGCPQSEPWTPLICPTVCSFNLAEKT